MFSRKADGPLTVQIPGPAEDRPSWTRVGVITAIGFIVGVAWPRLAGVRLGPSVPEATPSVASAAPPSSETAPAASVVRPATTSGAMPAVAVSPVQDASTTAPLAAAPPAAPPSVAIGRGVVFACRSPDGDSLKGGECGLLSGLDGLIVPRLRKLAECPDAAAASGKVHFVVHLDFPRGGVGIDLGRGHTVTGADALLACAKADLAGLGLTSIAHENPRYSVGYSVTFASAGATGGASGGTMGGGAASGAGSTGGATEHPGGAAAEGIAQVVWEVAIVRDTPKTGKVVARLQRGTELRLGPPKDGWYPAKFGDGFANEGWVYRGAVGR